MSRLIVNRIPSVMSTFYRCNGSQAGEWGSGSGKGGGSGGTVRDAGGSFGKREAAQEEEYFRRLQREQISQLKGHLHEEISHHEAEIRRLQSEISRHKEKIQDLASAENKIEGK